MADPTEQEVQQELFKQALAPEAPAAEPPKPEEQVPQPPAPPPAEPPQPAPQAGEGIPSWRLREEAEARRVAEDRARMLEERLNQIAARVEQAKGPEAPAPDFFADPTKATQAVVMEMMKQAFTPLVEEMRRNQAQNQQSNMARDRLVAGVVHGADKVNEAEEAFLKARADETLDTMDYERVVQAPNRYDEVVKWHRRQNVISSVGDDPNAWFEQQLEARMGDPQFQAKFLERVRTGAAGRPSEVKLPPSLSKVPAAQGSSDVQGDMSDRSLFAYAMHGAGRKQ